MGIDRAVGGQTLLRSSVFSIAHLNFILTGGTPRGCAGDRGNHGRHGL
jgi:hypothetical protein